MTGVLFRTEGLVGKQLELALQLFPGARKIGFLVNIAGPEVIESWKARRGIWPLSWTQWKCGGRMTSMPPFPHWRIAVLRQWSCKSTGCSVTNENGSLSSLLQPDFLPSMASEIMLMQGG